MIILATVPNTGTRFTASFLLAMDVEHTFHHLNDRKELRGYYERAKFVLTMRDPIFTWLYNRTIGGSTPELLKMWEMWDEIHSTQKSVTLRIDCPVQDRSGELDKVADFLGKEHTFKWRVIGAADRVTNTPSDYDKWLAVKKEMLNSQRIIDLLAPFRERYGYTQEL